MLRLCDRAHAPEDFAYGDLTLATDAEQVDCQEYWFRGVWFDHIGVFWKNFTAPGPLKNRRYEQTAPADDVGTLAARMTLKPGEKRAVRFIISWNLPNNHNYWLEENGGVPYTERDLARENSAFKKCLAELLCHAVRGLRGHRRLRAGELGAPVRGDKAVPGGALWLNASAGGAGCGFVVGVCAEEPHRAAPGGRLPLWVGGLQRRHGLL
ncbi:MAG: GH116 family glycosyl-hydrolase [Hydrogeniiclostridium mannosilyticum]